jgi:hypothetical protein
MRCPNDHNHFHHYNHVNYVNYDVNYYQHHN